MLTQLSGNKECFETYKRESEFSLLMKSRMDEGHVTGKNIGRVILALGSELPREVWLALESGTRDMRPLISAGERSLCTAVVVVVPRPKGASRVDVLRWGENGRIGGRAGAL